VEAGLHPVDAPDPAVAGEQGIEGAPQIRRRPGVGGGKADTETLGVHSGIGAAGCVGRGALAEEALKHALELDLYRSAGRLALPPDKPGTVEVQPGEECPAHRAEI